jgi:hypothetical protein
MKSKESGKLQIEFDAREVLAFRSTYTYSMIKSFGEITYPVRLDRTSNRYDWRDKL